MPSSRASAIPTIVQLVVQLQPDSILDVGVGFGKWGHLFREYTDVCQSSLDPPRYQRPNWKVRIDGIEGHKPYLTPMHDFLYDHIYQGNAAQILPTLPKYDLIFLGDVIEHFDKATGLALLREAIGKSNKAVIVSTPKYETDQGACCDNELERHRSLWGAGDFQSLADTVVRTIDGDLLLAGIFKPGLSGEIHTRIRRSGALGVSVRERMRRIIRMGGIRKLFKGKRG